MISIRARLLWSLLPAFVCISIAAGFSIYFSTKAEWEARLDAELANIAIDLRFTSAPADRESARSRTKTTNRDGSRTKSNPRVGGPVRFSETLFTNLSANVYCEVWLGNREVNLKTDNLEGGEVTRPATFSEDPLFYNATLADGLPLRAWAARLPMIMRDKQSPKVILAVERQGVDETLERLARNLVGGGLASCLLFSGLLILTLRISLRPLRKLGEQAAGMDAESLHERFSEKSAPADIRPIVERLNSLMAKLEESFARERRFSGDLAHELRTPLAAIRTTSEVAIKWPDQSSAEDFEEIQKLSAGLQQTLDSLLLLARMESSATEKHTETVESAQLVKECRALHTARAEERGLCFDLDFNPTSPLDTDPRLLRIIISNLIGNAVDYAPEGSTITLKVGTGGALFQCVNAAPNLADHDVDHLFERMWRKDAARTESGHAGLGLSIAQACAKALELNLCAELDQGKRLRITLKQTH